MNVPVLFYEDSWIASLVQTLKDQPRQIIVVVTKQEPQRLAALAKNIVGADSIPVVLMESFTQVGVFRYESARKLIASRLSALWKLHSDACGLVVCSAQGLSRVVPAFEWLAQHCQTLRLGDECEIEDWIRVLEDFSYSKAIRVEEIGEFSLRGSILDFWSPAHATPVRVEFFGDSIAKIRSFRVSDQRSFGDLTSCEILPVREFVWSENGSKAEEKLNSITLQQRILVNARAHLAENLHHCVPFAGLDDLAPAIFDSGFESFQNALHLLAKVRSVNLKFVTLDSTDELNFQLESLRASYTKHKDSARGKSLPAAEVESVFKDILSDFEATPILFPMPDWLQSKLENVSRQKLLNRMQAIQELLAENKIRRVCFLCASADSLLEFMGFFAQLFGDASLVDSVQCPQWRFAAMDDLTKQTLRISERISAAISPYEGVLMHGTNLIVSEKWIRGVTKLNLGEGPEVKTAVETFFAAQFSDFAEGDYVVHVQHGIARYLGLMSIEILGIRGDFLTLEYAGNDKIYIPVHKLNLVQKYLGSTGAGLLDSLKSDRWEKRKQKAKEDAKQMARELMAHQARRVSAPGFAFSDIDEDFVAFESAFPYDETPDQLRATREVVSDMMRPRAMDRLLCGDVGFGKTEVGMRAAYKCMLDGKQVAWLVPTSVLAHQHFRSAVDRFAGFGINVSIFDRSQSTKSNQILSQLKEGKIDLIIGTHRLLSKDIAFRDLGLLVVDEEQRFGVLQKEKIKTMAYGVDVLSMSATPIPRTLQMALVGLREMSLLTTPPKARLSVKTFVCPFDEVIVKESIQAELARGGQIFYVHNRVEELPAVGLYLNNLVSGLRVAVGHGQMSQKELDDTMIQFLDGQFDLLLCTTIIESGIDMPNVNTILVQNADCFGLAQLYQLRGRVGRRSTRGHAYFLTSDIAQDDGLKRLEILSEHQELGSGFAVASQDLEMRGSGNLLGGDQSGKILDVGLETYSQMLAQALREMGGVKVTAVAEAEIQFPLPTQIPDSYIENSKERLRMYRRFFGARTEDVLLSLIVECQDRFGTLPESVVTLCELARIRRWLLQSGATALVVGDDSCEIRFSREVLQHEDGSDQLVKRILDICNRQNKGARLTPDGRLMLNLKKRQFLSAGNSALSDLKKTLAFLAGDKAL